MTDRKAMMLMLGCLLIVVGIALIVVRCRIVAEGECEGDAGVYVVGPWGMKCIPR